MYLLRYFSSQAGQPRRIMSPAPERELQEKTSLTGARLCTLGVIHAVSPACAQKRAPVANAKAWERRVMRGSSCHTRRHWSDMAGGGSAEMYAFRTRIGLSSCWASTHWAERSWVGIPPMYTGPTCIFRAKSPYPDRLFSAFLKVPLDFGHFGLAQHLANTLYCTDTTILFFLFFLTNVLIALDVSA